AAQVELCPGAAERGVFTGAGGDGGDEAEQHSADQDLVAVPQLARDGQAAAVDPRPVGAAEVAHAIATPPQVADLGVVPRRAVVFEDEVVLGRAPDVQALPELDRQLRFVGRNDDNSSGV